MSNRLEHGDVGNRVRALHERLRAAGLEVDPAEVEAATFGPETRRALAELQRRLGLAVSGELDEATFAAMELREHDEWTEVTGVVVVVDEPCSTPPPPPPSSRGGHGGGGSNAGTVHGTLVDQDGAPLPRARVAAADQQLRSETALGASTTDATGAYQVRYKRTTPPNLVVRAYDAAGNVIAQSATVFKAAVDVEIDLTTAQDGVVRSPSRYTALLAEVSAQLHGTPLGALVEDKDTHEVQFVAQAAGEPFNDVAQLYIAEKVGTKDGLRAETLFGIFSQRIPASLGPALTALPDAGIDDAFTGQVMSGVLAHARAVLSRALSAALSSSTIPASYAALQESELGKLDALRVQSVGGAPYVRGKTALNDLLAAGSVAAPVQTAFVQSYAASGGRLGPTWKALRADQSLSKADLATLNTTLSAGELLTGNLPLVKDTLQRLSQKSLARVQDLALLDEGDWAARITALDPEATSIPQVLPNDTPAQRIARFSKALAERLAGRYPSTAFAGGLQKAERSSFTTKSELIRVLGANPTLNLKRTNIDQFVAGKKVTISAPALAELKTAQRLLRVSPHYASVEALKTGGYHSAQSIYFKGRAPFLAHMTEALGSAPLANVAFARAQMTYATALSLFGRFHRSLNGLGVAAMAPQAPPADTVANFPDLQALFGSLDYFQCGDCQSVYSPAAYLVDLLQYLKQFSATPVSGAPSPFSGVTTALRAFEIRRPEIQNLALDCDNTNVTLPYIDLVNEILEAAILPPPPPEAPPVVVRTTGTSAERRALPQHISQAAYLLTQGAVFPLSLPFELPFAQTTAYLAALGTSSAAVMTLFAGAPSGPSSAVIAGTSLGLNPEMQAVIGGTDGHQPWERWGFTAEAPASVVDPKTREPFVPAPLAGQPGWVAALSKVPVLLNRAGLTLPQLSQLLEVTWVTGGGVTLQLGAPGGILSSDTDAMTFTGLTATVLDRANRFLRLLTAAGLQMWELDWALEQATGGLLDDAFLTFLSGAIAVKARLKLPFQEVLSFWGPLETRDVPNHLGDEDSSTPSTYSEVFANPTMLVSWRSVFPPSPSPPAAFALGGGPILPPQAAPTPAESANLGAITAALGLSADDVSRVLAATTPATANSLTLATVNVLFRYARLASSLSLSIPDLILWIQLTGGTPFGTTPADTLECLRRLAVLRGAGIAVHDLDYLLRGGSAPQSSLALTTIQATVILQTIRDAVAKLTPAAQGDAPTVETIFVAALATATNVAANVVTPVLAKTGILPLPAATITALLASPVVDPTQFPGLVAGFTAVSKAAALFTALGTSEVEFAFVVQNAASFNWLDPSRLPTTTTSPYAAFEALLRAVKLDHRQSARTPKLFDVLGAWLVAGALPADLPTAIAGGGANNLPPLAKALNANVADVSAIAAALGAAPPSLNAATQVGSLADLAVLTSIASALDVVARYSISGSTLVSFGCPPAPWAASTGYPTGALATAGGNVYSAGGAATSGATAPSGTTTSSDGTITWTFVQTLPDLKVGVATAAFGAFQAQYPQSAWFGAVQPVEDGLRQSRRDALVAYLLGPGATVIPGNTFLTTDDIFDYFLIDPEMCACAVSTRLLQASLAIQQFVQQCFLNLTIEVTVDTTNAAWSEWSWRQQYRLWQANREVFLYPENYVLPELRTTASPFFTDLESDLRQSNCDANAAQGAFESYLRKLVDVSRLVVAAHYNQTTAAGSILHVFAHTRGTPWKWYYRTRTTSSPGAAGVWSAWDPLHLDIASDQLVPVVWDQRLHLIWPIFKPESEKQSNQPVPASDGSAPPQRAPQKLWSVDFAMSELSAGQWQAKRVLTEKMFFEKTTDLPNGDTIDRPPLAFTFRASQDPAFDLVITVYYNISNLELVGEIIGLIFGGSAQFNLEVATGTLSMPEAPLTVVQDPSLLPDASIVDLAQEPTYALVTTANLRSNSLATPSSYTFSGQDLVYGFYFDPNPGTRPVNVLCQTTASGPPASIELLGTVQNPRIVIPQQEGVFDSLDPFFVVDGGGGAGTSPRPTRTYLVEPEYYTVSSSPQELNDLAYVKQWTTRFAFQTFYHPYARTLLRELEIGGVPRLMSRNLQLYPQKVRGWATTFDFGSIFAPQPPVATPYPGAANAPDVGETALDFDPGSTGAYSLYNWEIFYHVPMFVASLLTQNQRYQDTMTWLEYIFNPTDSSGLPAPQRFWEMAPFYTLNATGPNSWVSQQIQNILANLAQGVSDPATAAALTAYMDDPFDPHAIASIRYSAYGKATVMKFLDNLIAWGDSLFTTYTAETVGQAEQLYILADMILGPQPVAVRLPASYQKAADTTTYAQIQSQLDQFSNFLVAVENLVVAPAPAQPLVQGTGASPSLPQFPGVGSTLFFCIPPNAQLLSYWTTVADRLYKIRHCLNLQGQAVPLPLYAPPINPLLAAEAAAAGGSLTGLSPTAPIYRFSTYLQKAVELTNDVRAFGALVLSALEKKDAETLAALRAGQELDIQTRMLDVKTQQVTEAQDQITVLQNQLAVAQVRHDFYSTRPFMNAWENQAIQLQTTALMANGLAIPLDLVAVVAHLVPSFSFGAAGFGGSPEVTASWGGGNIASSAQAAAGVVRAVAGLLTEQGGMVSTLGGYQRRMDDWNLQAQLAGGEMTQINSQITAATDRLNIANSELDIQNEQIANGQAVSDFLTNKYTNAQLYDWMITQLSTVYTQAYQLAFGLAQQAQNAYRYELGRYQDTFLQFSYWDSQHKGLTAGECLLFDLRRMEAQYLAENKRELELTKNVSLAITQPMALVQLRETGSCQVLLDEALFDADHPGHYFRRLRSVALTIPCVTGPYTGVNANLTLTTAVLRVTTTLPGGAYQPASAASPPGDAATFSVSHPGATIATSTGQNDAGLFEVNLKDERWLPFEGQGAVSAWTLELNPASNGFDFSTITDVVLHVRYTAQLGISEQTVLTAIAPPAGVPRSILVSVASTFSDAYYTFFNPSGSTPTQALTLPITKALFPFSNQGPTIKDIHVFFVLADPPATGTTMGASFTGTTGLTFTTGAPSSWNAPPSTLPPMLSVDASLTAPVAPQSFTLTLTSVPPSLATSSGLLDPAKVKDVLVVIDYSTG